METQIAKFSMRITDGQPVRGSIARVALRDIDQPRHTPRRSGLELYLMAPLTGEDGVPEAAIDLIKAIIGRVYRTHPQYLRDLILQRSDTARVLLEALDHQVRWTRTNPELASVSDFLTKPLVVSDLAGELQRGARVLLQYAPPQAGSDETDLKAIEDALEQMSVRIATRKASAADAADPDNHPRQRRILAASLSAADALKRSGAAATDGKSWASRERRKGTLFGVWSSAERAFVHPDFQFTRTGVHPELPKLLAVLRTRAGFDPATSDRGGWARAYWLYQPDTRLSEQSRAARGLDLTDVVAASAALRDLSGAGRTPAEVFAEGTPEAAQEVIELAETLPGAAAAA